MGMIRHYNMTTEYVTSPQAVHDKPNNMYRNYIVIQMSDNYTYHNYNTLTSPEDHPNYPGYSVSWSPKCKLHKLLKHVFFEFPRVFAPNFECSYPKS